MLVLQLIFWQSTASSIRRSCQCTKGLLRPWVKENPHNFLIKKKPVLLIFHIGNDSNQLSLTVYSACRLIAMEMVIWAVSKCYLPWKRSFPQNFWLKKRKYMCTGWTLPSQKNIWSAHLSFFTSMSLKMIWDHW